MVDKIFLVISESLEQSVLRKVRSWYLSKFFKEVNEPEDADKIFILGGDGTMLSAIRAHWHLKKPFCGINFGHVGFLLNNDRQEVYQDLADGNCEVVKNRMLHADVTFLDGQVEKARAVNDFYFRGREGMTKINVEIDGVSRFSPLNCDGVVISTALGSTAYNASAGGMILPIGTNSIVMTGISPAIHHHFRTVQLSDKTKIVLRPEETAKRPTVFYVDGHKFSDVEKAEISLSTETIKLLYAKCEGYREKVMKVQFPS